MEDVSIHSYFCHSGTGTITFDMHRGTKHFEPWWALVICDDEIIRYYAWFLKKWGKPVDLSTLWKTHISWIKGDEPPHKRMWGKRQMVKFYYTNQIRFDNHKHAWLDVYSPDLSNLRQELGLPAKERYHLTIGRFR